AMKLIPEEWSIGVLSQFLSGSVRLSLHKSRTTKLLSSLSRGENLKASLERTSISQNHCTLALQIAGITFTSKQNCSMSAVFWARSVA
ncbi:transforming growth factor, beta receptor associated protein 1, partial [Desmophyllum pertusum]